MVSNNQGVMWRDADELYSTSGDFQNGQYAALAFDRDGKHGVAAFTNYEQSQYNYTIGFKSTKDYGMTWQTVYENILHYTCEGPRMGAVTNARNNSIFYMVPACGSGVIYMYDATIQIFHATASPKRIWDYIFTDDSGANVVARSDDYYCSSDFGKTWSICETM